jgi:hypothetical protein
MSTHRLILPEQDNKLYYDLLHRSNDLIERRDNLNKRLQSIDMTSWFPSKAKRVLSSTKPDIESYVKDCLTWKHEAANFILNPNLIFPETNDSPLAFIHFIENLRDTVNRTEEGLNLVENNYNTIHSFIGERTNFRIAIWSFIIALIALIVSLIPLFMCK